MAENLDVHCKKCGKNLKSDWNYCPYCQYPVSSDTSEGKKVNGSKNVDIIYAFVYSLFIILFLLFGFNLLFFICALVTIVTAKISYPDSLLLTLIFWISIALCAFIIFYVIISMIFCGGALGFMIRLPEFFNSCPG